MSHKQVIYFGADGPSGYANAAKGYMYDLLQHNCDVYFEPVAGKAIKDRTKFSTYFSKNLKKLPYFSRSAKLKNAEIVLHIAPDMWSGITKKYADLFGDRKVIGRTVWDFDPLPESWVIAINQSIVNVVSVPSEWNKDVFIKSGVKKEIIVEPHTVPDIEYQKIGVIDTLSFAKIFSPTPIDLKRIEKRIKFLNISTMTSRKNVTFLLESYLDTFEYDDETFLILKITDSKSNLKKIEDTIQECIIKNIKNKGSTFAYAPFALLTDVLDFDNIQSLIDGCDVYVNASRGEGFNIPCYMAMKKNKHIVTPLHGGMLDYLSNYPNLYAVDYRVVNIGSIDNVQSNTKMWINLLMQGIDLVDDDLTRALKSAHIDLIYKNVYFGKLEQNQLRTTLKESGNLFPVFFKSGWYEENLNQGVWSKGNSELVVGGDIYKLELLVEAVHSTSLKLTVNNVQHVFDLPRGNYSIKIINKRAKHIQIETDTIGGELINRDADSQYGIKIVELYVNGIRNKTSRLIIESSNFSESILSNSGNAFDKTYRIDEQFADAYKYPKKFNLDRHVNLLSHQRDWSHCHDYMMALNSLSGVYCDTFLDNTFGAKKAEGIVTKNIPYNKKWVGFVHNPPNIPSWFAGDTTSFGNIYQDPYFLASLKNCAGIFTMSEYHAKYIRHCLPNIPVESVYQPTIIPETQFDFDKFTNNKNKKLIAIGWWLIKLNALYTVKTDEYQKIRLLSDDICADTLAKLENIDSVVNNYSVNQTQKSSVRELKYTTIQAYDQLLSENVVYMDLYDSSSSGVLVDCIARGTPVFVNRLPAVVEYLGEGYPLYIESQYDLENKLKDFDLIRRGHLYLRSNRYKIEMGHFLDQIVNSKIYKSL